VTPAQALAAVKARPWFYAFELPDGTRTSCTLPPAVQPIHLTRRRVLREVLRRHMPDAAALTALDLGCHQGYFSVELAQWFRSVLAMDLRMEHLQDTELIAQAYGLAHKVRTLSGDVQTALPADALRADFVLCYGLLYHLENPLRVLRWIAQICQRALLLESQILPYELTGPIEDGQAHWARPIQGLFALAGEDAACDTSGTSGLALVPSLQAVRTALQAVGFASVTMIPPDAGDYEQFARGHRVLVYAEKG
jgi:SAM-dependent methyltransferase